MQIYIYNHRRDPVDERDHKFHLKLPQIEAKALPTHVDLRTSGFIPPVLDQSSLGSCTANATSNALRFLLKKEKLQDWSPSRLFIYYYSRLIEGTVSEDSGCVIRDVMKEVATYGACSESNWPYDVEKFTLHPPSSAVRAAQTHIKNFQYMSVNQDLITIKNALVQGLPVIFGMDVYSSFESDAVAQSGIVPMPNVTTETLLGGHCQAIYGFDDSTQRFTVMNSWSANWGDKGFSYIPYAYILSSHASDFWVCKSFV